MLCTWTTLPTPAEVARPACPKTASAACDDGRVIDDFERCYRFMQSRDPRYDGFFFVAVTSTGVYCRPSCPARLPYRRNVRLFRERRRPRRRRASAPASAATRMPRPARPRGTAAPDVAGRAVRLIADGAWTATAWAGSPRGSHFSERQLNRILVAELGAGPVALARAQRAQSARTLIETTELPFAEVAVGAGFGERAAVQRHAAGGLRPDADRAAPPARRRRRRAPRGRDRAAAPGPRAVRRRLAPRVPRRSAPSPGVEEVAGGDLPPHAAR